MGDKKRKPSGLKSELTHNVCVHYQAKSHSARSNAIRACNNFAVWCRDKQYSNSVIRSNPQPVIQAWADTRLDAGRSPSTVHTEVAGVCCGFGLSMSNITLPKRTSANKSKSLGQCDRADRCRNAAANQDIVRFQSMVGGRRAALERLTGSDLVRDESEHLCVRFVGDKGGKTQYQVIAPENEVEVSAYFSRCAPDQLLFGKIDRNLDLHGIRAEHARTEYNRYAQICSTPAGRAQMRTELWARFYDSKIGNKAYQCAKSVGQRTRCVGKFASEMADTPYVLRGDNRVVALQRDRPTEYDRLPLLCVSVFSLSHWRNEVTVKHYML